MSILGNDKVTVQLPVLPLLPHQQIAYENILTDKKKYVAISAHRRWGKDVVGFQILIAYALKNVGVYYYLAPFRKQIKEIIVEGKLYNGMNFLDLVPDEVVVKTDRGNKVKNDDLSMRLTNGSIIYFRGCDNADGQVGVGATGCVFTEFAMINPMYYKLFRPIVSRMINDTGKGFMLFISTPRGVTNHFSQLFKRFLPKEDDTPEEVAMKAKWSLMWLPANKTIKRDGTRLLSDEFLYEELANMGEDAFNQEYMLHLTTSGKGVWYGKQIIQAEKEGRIKAFGNSTLNGYEGHYWKGLPVYVSWDLGVNDSTFLSFFQINPMTGKPRYIHCYRDWGKTLDFYAKYCNDLAIQKGYGQMKHILPHDSNQRVAVASKTQAEFFDQAVKRVDILRSYGLDCLVLDKAELGMEKFRVMTRINTVRKLFSEIEIDNNACFGLVEGLKGYVKKWNRALNDYEDKPDHNANNKASDIADSFGYGLLYYEKYLRKGVEIRSTSY